MRLVKDWRKAWRWYSTQALVAVAAIPQVWATLPPELRLAIPEDWMRWVVTAVAIGGLIGRLIDQGGDDDT